MSIWPEDERRAGLMVMGLLAFSTIVSVGYAAAAQFESPIYRGLPLDIWPWLTTALFLLVVILGVIGLLVIKHEFGQLAQRMTKFEDKFDDNISRLWVKVDEQGNRITKIQVICDARHNPETI